MKKYKKIMLKLMTSVSLVVLVFVYLTTGVSAQDESTFGIAPLSGPNGILLVIGGPALHPNSASANDGWIGYYLYRRVEGDTGFVRITPKPLSRPGTLNELENVIGGSIDGFEKFVNLSSKSELWQRIEQNDSSVLAFSLMSKNLRKALGLLLWDNQVIRGKKYEYRATKVSSNGQESKPCEIQKVTFGSPQIPLLGPLKVKGKSTKQGIDISWQANPNDSGTFTYSVYRCPDSIGTYLRLNVAALTFMPDTTGQDPEGSFTDTTAQPGRTYYYAVVSVDYAGNESPRTPQLAWHLVDETPPPIPQNVIANPSALGIVITWDKVAADDLVGYNIYRSLNPDSFYIKLNTALLPADTGYYEDKATGLSDRYFYRVSAVDETNHESDRSARSLSLFENQLQPIPPQGIHVEPKPNGIAIGWERSEEADIRGYYIYRADSYNGELSQVSPLLDRDTTEYLDTSAYLSARGQYWYLIQAINYTGITSKFSLPASTSPQKPETTDAPTSIFGYHDEMGVRLFWTLPENNMVAGYNIYRAVEGDSLKWVRMTSVPINREISEYIDTSVQIGSAYQYNLRSINTNGTEGTSSHNVRIIAFEPAPLPPSGIRVSRESVGLKLFWNKTFQRQVIGYRIYRRSERDIAALLVPDIVSTGVTEYRDASVKKGQRYFYSVSCVDKTGAESERSMEVSFLNE